MSLAIIRSAHDHTRSVFALLKGKPWEAPIEDVPALGLSVRAAGVCKTLGVRFWQDLADVTERDVLLTPNAGKVTLREIREQAEKRGIRLGSAVV